MERHPPTHLIAYYQTIIHCCLFACLPPSADFHFVPARVCTKTSVFERMWMKRLSGTIAEGGEDVKSGR